MFNILLLILTLPQIHPRQYLYWKHVRKHSGNEMYKKGWQYSYFSWEHPLVTEDHIKN